MGTGLWPEVVVRDARELAAGLATQRFAMDLRSEGLRNPLGAPRPSPPASQPSALLPTRMPSESRKLKKGPEKPETPAAIACQMVRASASIVSWGRIVPRGQPLGARTRHSFPANPQ
jgi:hypothetical protein